MTLGIMLTRIATELGRSDLASASKDAIRSAIEFYERKRFHFNELRTSFVLLPGQEYYDTLTDIQTLIDIDSLKVTTSGTSYPLTKRDFVYIDTIQTSSGGRGDPTDYTYYGNQIRMYPIPSTTRTANIALVRRFPTISVTTSSNAWFTDAEELIRCRALWTLNTFNIRNLERAAVFKQAEREALDMLLGETTSKTSSGGIRPTSF